MATYAIRFDASANNTEPIQLTSSEMVRLQVLPSQNNGAKRVKIERGEKPCKKRCRDADALISNIQAAQAFLICRGLMQAKEVWDMGVGVVDCAQAAVSYGQTAHLGEEMMINYSGQWECSRSTAEFESVQPTPRRDGCYSDGKDSRVRELAA